MRVHAIAAVGAILGAGALALATAACEPSCSDLLACGDQGPVLSSGGGAGTTSTAGGTGGGVGGGSGGTGGAPFVVEPRARSLATSFSHSCFVRPDKTLRCWGWNLYGQLGDGTTTTPSTPTQPVGLGEVASLTEHAACAITDGGDVYCWGSNGSFQVSPIQVEFLDTPTKVEGASMVLGGSNGFEATVVFTEQGALSWGTNFSGVLGNGESFAEPSPVFEPDVVVNGAGIVEVSVVSHGCGLYQNGEVRCWGQNTYGQLGDGTEESTSTPTLVAGLKPVSTLGVGHHFSCVVDMDGAAWCWGRNSSGQLGDGTTFPASNPVQVDSSVEFTRVTAGWEHACGLTSDGSVFCWGLNEEGQLGDGSTTNSLLPVQVVDVSDAVDLSCGGDHCCVEGAADTVRCWGEGSLGRLGDGNNSSSSVPVQVQF